MKRKFVKRVASVLAVSALCTFTLPVFADEGWVRGGVRSEQDAYEMVKPIDAKAVSYRSLYKTSFEDGTWNIIDFNDIYKTEDEWHNLNMYFTYPRSSKYVEAGLQDLPLDFGTWVLYDIKMVQDLGKNSYTYAIKYAPKVTNAVYHGENICTAYIGGHGSDMLGRATSGFMEKHKTIIDFSALDDKILISPNIEYTGALPKVGERVWTRAEVSHKNAEDSDVIYLFIVDKEGANRVDSEDLGVNRLDIVGCKLHLEDKSYRNFSPVVVEDTTSDVKLSVNGDVLDSDVSPFIYDGTTMVPLRLAATAVGADVDFKSDGTQLGDKISLQKGADNVALFTKSNLIYKSETDIGRMSTAPVIVNGTSYVPVRAVAEALGCEVGFDADTRTVTINS